MIWNILFVVFFFFTHKQVYAGSHFTGSWTFIGVLLKIFGFINVLLEWALLVIVAVKISIIHAVVLLGVSLVVISVLNNTISRRTMRKMQKDGWSIDGTENAIQKQYYYTCYNHECDVVSSVIAEIGVVVNMMIIAAFFVF